MNNIEHTIVFTFSTMKGIQVEAKWVILIKNSSSKNGKINRFLCIKDTPCQIEKEGDSWIIRLMPQETDITREYLHSLTSPHFKDDAFHITVSEAEKNYIESIADGFINPFAERINGLNRTSSEMIPE